MSEKGTTDTKPTTTKTARSAPRPRSRTGGAPAVPAKYVKARALFEAQAQQWLLERPGKTMCMPEDLPAVARLGVPCQACGASIYRDRDRGHRVSWRREPGHWAAGITATCSG